MTTDLVVLLSNRKVGQVAQGTSGVLTFRYDEEWREDANAYPLSLSLPLAEAEYAKDTVRPYLTGLLPDNVFTLTHWGRRFGVSPRNPFALLGYVGEDCAGAVQFVHPDRVDAVRGGLASGQVEWLTEHDVAVRLKALREDPGAGRAASDPGQFSLAGAQPKTALLFDSERWGIPSGRTPTTHILKPPVIGYEGFAENEHMCLSVARALGLPTAQSRLQWFEDELAIVVERYDRRRVGRRVERIHQEDFCQSLGVLPALKYESDGGPGASQIVEILRAWSSASEADILTFVDALALNWLLGATDAHAKNYSVLLGSDGIRLAPLYDLISALPYPTLNTPKLKLAMRIGDTRLVHRVGLRHWQRFAADVRLPADQVVQRVTTLAQRVIDVVPNVQQELEAQGLRHAITGRIGDAVVVHAKAGILR